MSLVLDSSATLAWIYPDEITPDIERIFEHVLAHGAWVPGLWRLEVANSLHVAVQHKRIDKLFLTKALSDLALMHFMIDSETNDHAWTTTLLLADRFHLTLYDAAYLELAGRRDLPLATLDRDLRRAAGKLGISLLGQ